MWGSEKSYKLGSCENGVELDKNKRYLNPDLLGNNTYVIDQQGSGKINPSMGLGTQ